MAALSSKKTATANTRTLRELHLISLGINLLTLISLFVVKRPVSKWAYAVFSIPAIGCQYTLEKSGRPVYSTDLVTQQKKLIRSGDDIKGPGLFEYMFDCIYITWFCDLLMVALGTNKVWFLYLVIPSFIAYKVGTFAKSFFGSKSLNPQEVLQPGNAQQEKSKRQTKLEQRSQKGQKVRTR